MSILRRLVERRDLLGSSALRIPLNSEGGYALATGEGVTADSATRLSAVYAANRLLSQTVASLPVDAYRKVGAVRVEQQMPKWLERPNPDFNRFEFLEQTMTSLLLRGNAYLFKVFDGAAIDELWVAHPDYVTIEGGPGKRVYKLTGRGVTERFAADEVVHIRGTSRPGSMYGMSVIDEARQSLGLALAAEQYGARFFGNGASPGGVIEVPGEPDKVILRRMALEWKASHQGLATAHEPGFLTGGAKWQTITIPNDAAQFLETRKLQISEIARWFGVPAHMIGDLEHATFSNIEHQAIEFVVHGVRPWLVRIESALNPLLGLPAGADRRTNTFLKFNVEGLLRGDAKARAEFYNTMRNIGAFNADDVRALEDLPPIPGGQGQGYWMPLNMTSSDVKNKVDAAGALVRSGYDPAGALVAVGLDPIKHLGLMPVTVQTKAEAKAPAEGLNGSQNGSSAIDRAARLLAAAELH